MRMAQKLIGLFELDFQAKKKIKKEITNTKF